jgi:hypothetical protein
LGAKVVVTWGFPPNEACLNCIRRFRDSGFTPWWFNADQTVARERYIMRNGIQETEQLFDPQMVRIVQAKPDVDDIYQGHTIQTLSNDGYTSTEEIYIRRGGLFPLKLPYRGSNRKNRKRTASHKNLQSSCRPQPAGNPGRAPACQRAARSTGCAAVPAV